jgi:hypothetical protein
MPFRQFILEIYTFEHWLNIKMVHQIYKNPFMALLDWDQITRRKRDNQTSGRMIT